MVVRRLGHRCECAFGAGSREVDRVVVRDHSTIDDDELAFGRAGLVATDLAAEEAIEVRDTFFDVPRVLVFSTDVGDGHA